MLLSFVTATDHLQFSLPLLPGEGAPAIEVIRTGTFTDMNKRTVTITAADLDAFVANYQGNVAGQDVPIDVDHRRQEAAGWIARFFREGDILRAIPQWNPHGARLVGEQMYRYISATINLAQKAIISVSLTNFPAVKNLAPISLSEFSGTEVTDPAPADEVFLLFTTERDESMLNTNPDATTPPAAPAASTTTPPAAPAAQSIDLTAELASVRTAMQEQLGQALAQFRTELTQAAALSEQQRLSIIQEVVNGMREEQQVADFAQAVTGTGRYALPVKGDTLRNQLMGIPQPHRTTVMEILRTVHGNGTVDFSEAGTSQGRDRALLTLEPVYADALKQFKSLGGTVDAFFSENADLLGNADQYDLRAFA